MCIRDRLGAAAAALHLSYETVNTHLDHLRTKSGFRYLHQLVVWVLINGWWGSLPAQSHFVKEAKIPQLGEGELPVASN